MENKDKLQAVLDDFRLFLFMVWKHLNLPAPTDVQYDLAQYLQHGPTRAIIEAFRGVGKSWITSAFCCWCWLRDPQIKIMVVSASKERADAFSTFTLRLIREMPILRHLRPGPDQRDSRVAFDVGPARADHSPSLKSVGITGQITGSRADIIIGDDIEVPKNSDTQTMREKLSELVKEFDAILKPLKTSRIIYLGTPQCEESLYNILPERGYVPRIWPARVPGKKQLLNYGDNLAPFILDMVEKGKAPGTPTDPKRFDDFDLMQREASYGRAGFALQFMLDTRLSDAEKFPLKLSDLIIWPCDNEVAPTKLVWAATPDKIVNDVPNVGFSGDRFYHPMSYSDKTAKYQGSVMSIDPSGRGSDETGFAVVKMLHSMLFLTRAGGLRGGYDEETLTKLALVAKEQRVNEIVIESNFGDGMFTELFKPILKKHWNCTVTEIRHSTQKEKRICDVMEPVMNQHRLIVDPRVIKDDYENIPDGADKAQFYRLFYQMTRITRDRGAIPHDDRLEAVAMAVQYWVEQMARDLEEADQEHRNELLQIELDRFMENALGASQNEGNSWLSSYDM